MKPDVDDAERKLPFYLSDIESFEKNLVWKELLETIKIRISIIDSQLRTKTELNDILRAQGEMLSCQFFLEQIDLLKQDVKEQQEQEKESDDVD